MAHKQEEESNNNRNGASEQGARGCRGTNACRWGADHQRKILIRRRKVATVRLGGQKRKKPRVSIVRLVKRIRVRWLKLKYWVLLKKLKHFYYLLLKELHQGGPTMVAVHERILMESYLGVPVVGLYSLPI